MKGNYETFEPPEDYNFNDLKFEQKMFAIELKKMSELTKKIKELQKIYDSELELFKKENPEEYKKCFTESMQEYYLLRNSKYKKAILRRKNLNAKFDESITKLWDGIKNYAFSIIHSRCAKYKKSNDYFEELSQECSFQFGKVLPYYNPFLHTPTTFFKLYFYEVISRYLRNESQHMTQNDANNWGKINAAKKQFMMRGITPDFEMLSEATGLSRKVVKNTMDIAMNSQYADIDEQYDLASKKLNPEQEFFKNMKEADVRKAVKLLSPEDQEFLAYYLNLNSSTKRNYKAVGEHFNMTPSQVKSTWNRISTTLANSELLRDYNPKKTDTTPTVTLYEETSEEVANDIINAMDKKNSKK